MISLTDTRAFLFIRRESLFQGMYSNGCHDIKSVIVWLLISLGILVLETKSELVAPSH
jgi:hypothetical protein